jgi:alkylation response protein AidB-like acyl-CoA dehydrogenase
MSGSETASLAEPWRDPEAVVGPTGVSGTFRMVDGSPNWVTVLAPAGAALVTVENLYGKSVRRELADADPSVWVQLVTGTFDPAVVAGGSDAAAIVATGRVLAAAMLVGVLEATRDASVSYVSVREQFGKPIGAFQAVKHRCADMAVRAEAAGSLLWLAALTLAGSQPEASRLAAGVKALASEYALQSAHDNVQNHGGMGFTAECSAHLYVKRALTLSVTLGSPDNLLAEVARC